jgi:protoporphyrinogen oxidase
MIKNRIAVVGAGLAGLTAAYRILQHGHHTVDIYESLPYVGGRVQSRKVLGHSVDFGGFLIYPWYEHAHALFTDLGVSDTLVKTPLSDIVYFLDDNGIALREDEISFPVRDGLQIWTKSLFKILAKSDLSAPDLTRFEGKTISEYLRAILGTDETETLYETFFDTVNQGYCYGPAAQSKAAFMMPIIRQVKFHGDIRTTSFFPQGGSVLTDHLLREITALGGTVHYNTPITRVEGTTLFFDNSSFSHDAIVFAQNVSPDLYTSILPDVTPECWYTHFITAAIKLPKTPVVGNSQHWGAAFYAPDAKKSPQALSIINLSSLYGEALDGCVMMNIVLREKEPASVSSDDVARIAREELQRLFPDIHDEQLVDFVHWTHTMPVAQERFVQAVRDHHGKNGYYFAGDFLGAPSIETAIATGNHAAASVLVNTHIS